MRRKKGNKRRRYKRKGMNKGNEIKEMKMSGGSWQKNNERRIEEKWKEGQKIST